MKKCYTCKEMRALTGFNKNRARKDGLSSICRECGKIQSRKYYSENTEKHKKETYKRKLLILERNRKFIYEYLADNSCIDCGESDPRVLEFDHMRDKTHNISYMIQAGHSIQNLQNEIKKCEVRCANCHRRKTSIDFGWYTNRLYQKSS